MLNAILVAVETIDADSLGEFATAKSLVLTASGAADDEFTRSPSNDMVAAAQSDERAKFCVFIDSLNELNVWDFEELPYRRVLSLPESDRVWAALKARWGILAHSYWYPLTDATVPNIVAFRAGDFHEALPAAALRGKLSLLGIRRVWELREFGPEYEEDVELFTPSYNGAEGFWTSPARPTLELHSQKGAIMYRIATIACSVLFAGICWAQPSPVAEKKSVTPEALKKEIDDLKSSKIAWREIAWKSCLLEGLKESRAQNKPALLWVFIDRPVDDARC